MSENFTVKFLTAGVGGLMGQSIDLFGQNIQSFVIGDVAGWDPTGEETGPVGNTTFIGGREHLKVKFEQPIGRLTISMVIPEEYDQIVIGNVVLYVRYAGKIIPFAFISFPQQIIKQNESTDILDQRFPYPGTRMIIGLSLTYVDLEEADLNLTVQIETPNYSNIPMFGSEDALPNPQGNPWQQFIINELPISGNAPTLVTKTNEDLYYASPLFQNLQSPKYGILDGGHKEAVRVRWVWGRYFTTDSQLFGERQIGGNDFSDTGQPRIVGGAAF